MKCPDPTCSGEIVDGYCDLCGMKPPSAASTPSVPSESAGDGSSTARVSSASGSAQPIRGAGPSQMTVAASTVSRGTTRTRASRRRGLGAGLVDIPEVPKADPLQAVLANPTVPENRRFCARCSEPVGRSREGEPGRTSGFCRKCGQAFDFDPKLVPGDLVAGQYEVAGCLAHGGMGWIYLATDRNVSDRWVVLKGLLNAGDPAALEAALAEREFLAEVEDARIVKIHNFVLHEGSGYIVMEYVGGSSLKQILKVRREANGGQPNPLPATHALAYMLEILPAFAYLHARNLLFCDFKLDNVIQTEATLKLIDLGGVYRVDRPASAVFGTVGYQAPEIARLGPSPSSDLFTVARTLAVLCIDFRGYSSTFKYTLPPQDSVALFSRHDSLYRLLLKATAPEPADRFQSADEMAEQLYGVLREVVADEEGHPVPAPSSLFTDAFRAQVGQPDWRVLPRPQVDRDDPSAGYLGAITSTDPEQTIKQLLAIPDRTVEVELRLAAVNIEQGQRTAAEALLKELEARDPREWRATWYRGISALAAGDGQAALGCFDAVYQGLPGELAPKLALGMAAEVTGDVERAARWYEIVARTDASITSASFGLARCRVSLGDRAGAVAAYEQVPDSSSGHLDAQVARIRALSGGNGSGPPGLEELVAAASSLEKLPVEGEQRDRLSAAILDSALGLGLTAADANAATLLGHRLEERDLRLGLETCYRALARRAATRAERIQLVDQANRTRPLTWT